MKRIQFNSILVIAALAATLRAADDSGVPIARIELDSPRTYVVAGRGMAIQATPYNAVDAALAGRSLQWTVSDPSLAFVDDGGNLQGIRPGGVTVTAKDPARGASASLNVYVYPARLTTTLSESSIEVGDTTTASAQAFDADGKTISGLTVTFSLGDNAFATVSGATITAKAEGRTSILGSLDLGLGFDPYTTSAILSIAPRSDYRVKRLVATDTISTNVTLGVPVRAAAFGNYVASISSLSNGGQGVVLSRLGQKARILDSAGSTVEGTDRVIASFLSVAVNANGDVAALAFLPAEWCEEALILYRASANWKPSLVLDTNNCNIDLQPRSLDSKSGILYRAGNDVLHWSLDGALSKVLSYGDSVAGLKALGNLNNGFGYTPFGNAVFFWVDASNVTSAVAWDGASKFTRITGVGSVLDGRTITDIQMPVEINAGEFLLRVGSTNWSGIARFKGSSATVVASNGVNNLGWIQSYFGGIGEDIYFHADRDGKTSLFHLNGSSLTPVITYLLWREIGPVWVVSSDTVVTHSSTGPAPLAVQQFKGTAATTVFGPGVAADGSAYLGLSQNALSRAAVAASPLIRTSGDFIMKWMGAGLTTVLKPGDTLPGNRTLAYIHTFTANRKGDFVIAAQTQQNRAGIWAYRNGALQLLIETDQVIGATTSLTYQYAFGNDRAASYLSMNSKGQVAAALGTSNGSYLYLFDTGASAASARIVAQLNASAPGGGNYNCCPTVNLLETGQVAFSNNVIGKGSTLFYWDGASPVRRVIGVGDNDPAGRQINYIWYPAGSSIDKMYFNASTNGFGNSIYTFDSAGKVDTLVQPNSSTSSGLLFNGLFGSEFTVNAAGDLLFPGYTPNGFTILVRRPSDFTDKVAAIASRKTAEGDWLLTPFPGAGTDTGDTFFPAYSWSDGKVRFGLYQATPR